MLEKYSRMCFFFFIFGKRYNALPTLGEREERVQSNVLFLIENRKKTMKTEKEFLKSVIYSEKFKKMSQETQVLYFHLFTNTNENGITNASRILKRTQIDTINMGILEDNNFIKTIDVSGFMVSIVGWDEIKFEEI